jgi:hypothetical protein
MAAFPLTSLGQCLVDERQPARAIPLLSRALAIREGSPGDASDLAFTRFQLARALWALGQERARALELAQKARAVFAGARGRERELGQVNAWLKQH